jgi:hypothetical protein
VSLAASGDTVLARLITSKRRDRFNQPAPVENRLSDAGNVCADACSRLPRTAERCSAPSPRFLS